MAAEGTEPAQIQLCNTRESVKWWDTSMSMLIEVKRFYDKFMPILNFMWDAT